MRTRMFIVSLLVFLSFGLTLRAEDKPATTQPTATLPGKDDKPATFRLVTQGKLQMLRAHVKIWDDARYVFLRIPQELSGTRFIQNRVSMQPQLAIDIVRDGYVVVAAPNSGKDKFSVLEADGWVRIPLAHEFLDTCDTHGWTLFRRDCKHGEQLVLAVQRYHAPFIILFR